MEIYIWRYYSFSITRKRSWLRIRRGCWWWSWGIRRFVMWLLPLWLFAPSSGFISILLDSLEHFQSLFDNIFICLRVSRSWDKLFEFIWGLLKLIQGKARTWWDTLIITKCWFWDWKIVLGDSSWFCRKTKTVLWW